MFSVWTLAIVALAFPYLSSATATYNQENLSPCLVASVLEAACVGGTLNIDPLGTDAFYIGPSADGSNKCICSTVVYSLISACALCQEKGFIKWSQWRLDCAASDITIGQIPITIPQPISVPSWAYLNVTITDDWDSSAALAVHNSSAPDTTSLPPATGTTSPPANGTTSADLATGITTSPSATEAPLAPGSTTSTSTPGKKSNHAGPIAGGVIGGVIGFVLIGVGAFVLVRRRNTAASASSSDTEKFDLAASPPPFMEYAWLPFPMQTDSQPQKLYDPSDPSTFPRTPVFPTHVPPLAAPDGVATGYHPQNPLSLLPESGPSGRYTGAPEI
ncbi:hypothetical protein BU17DRAFT_68391 [Hysterangium stoloniferum]|nr:hypothetical protein BU17DRAFT_68391 [Hysterangium stoloniferum]